MKFGFDGRELIKHSGIATYSRELIRAMARKYSKDVFLLFCSINEENLLIKEFVDEKNIDIIPVFKESKGIKIFRKILKQINKRKWKNISKEVNLVHQTNQYSLITNSNNLVVTVHDLFPLDDYDEANSSSKKRYKTKMTFIAKNAGLIFVPSEYVKNEFIKYFPDASDKIIVTYEAVSKDFKPSTYSNEFSKRFDIKEELKYFLFVGRLFQRKNIYRIVSAFQMLQSEYKEIELVLVINGTNKEKKDFNNFLNKLKLGNCVKIIEGVEQKELIDLYSFATGFVFPSLAEGFGLPALEAMQCGCPVITSNNTSLPEVVGKAAFLIDPYKEKNIYLAMKILLTEPKRRKKLIETGYRQASHFSWEKTAELTYKGYLTVPNTI